MKAFSLVFSSDAIKILLLMGLWSLSNDENQNTEDKNDLAYTLLHILLAFFPDETHLDWKSFHKDNH